MTLDPQVRKVLAACSGLFFEVNSQYNQPSKGVYDSGWELAGWRQGDGVGTEVGSDSVACSRRLHDRLPSEDLLVMIDLYGSGSTARQVAETFTVSLRSVKRLHQQRGVRRR